MRPRILLAEDDDELRWSLVAALQHDGFDVFAVANGGDLVDLICDRLDEPLDDERGPAMHAIVTDVRMPGFDGLSILCGLHEVGCGPPLIVISAFGDEEMRLRAHTLGAVAFLDKPFELRALERSLHEAVGRPIVSPVGNGPRDALA
jgi:DNA-binding response OmpR family regulator